MKNPHKLIALAILAFILLKMINLAALKLMDYILLALAGGHLAFALLCRFLPEHGRRRRFRRLHG